MDPTSTNNTTPSNDDNDEWAQYEETDNTDQGMQSYSSQELRQMANTYFAQRDYDSALPLYTMALEALIKEQEADADSSTTTSKEELMVTFLCNRAACLFRMELYEDAKNDALQSVEISKGKNSKASFRLAKTQMALGEYTDAITTLEKSIAMIPSTFQQDNTTNNNDEEQKNALFQKEELHKLLIKVRTTHLQQKHKFSDKKQAMTLAQVQSIRSESNRTPSIREFDVLQTLGEGNFSRVVSCTHSVTKEQFALKIIEKKKAEQLGKQQHPNVYNEIEMEKRVLLKRLREDSTGEEIDGWEGYSRRIVKLYHCFQDYNSLYFLMDLYSDCGDLWSALRLKNQMVGAHPSLAKIYMYELLEALEFIHSKGIVHRDLKAENILLSPSGHLILIDFGTAKDLIQTDLNGPEFVGTADFMAPEAVMGTAGPKEAEAQKKKEANESSTFGSDHTLDLWEFGAVIYQVLTGITPFSAPSPFLQFLKIQRGNLYRPIAIPDDDAWDLISKLLKVNPKERLGAECFEVVKEKEGEMYKNRIIEKGNGYDTIRNHPYFASIRSCKEESSKGGGGDEKMPIPSLRDLCIRACAQLVKNDSLDIEMEKKHPPGDMSSHDMLRLNSVDRQAVMALLEKLRLLSEPRVYRRFFQTKQEARLTKIRECTRDFVGLTQMIDKQHRFPTPSSEGGENDISDVMVTMTPINYMHISNPLFVEETNISCEDEEQRKQWIGHLKESLKYVNKSRPKLAIASGYLDAECRKLLGKINESIPVILNDGKTFYSFWSSGGQGLVLSSRDFVGDDINRGARSEQMVWLREQLEQSRTAQHLTFAFIDCDIKRLPSYLLRALAKGRVLCLFSVSSGPVIYSKYTWKPSSTKSKVDDSVDIDDDDEASVSSALTASSNESNTDVEAQIMKIVQRGDATLRCLTLEEYGEWKLS